LERGEIAGVRDSNASTSDKPKLSQRAQIGSAKTSSGGDCCAHDDIAKVGTRTKAADHSAMPALQP
jgi:hypothetical protein